MRGLKRTTYVFFEPPAKKRIKVVKVDERITDGRIEDGRIKNNQIRRIQNYEKIQNY